MSDEKSAADSPTQDAAVETTEASETPATDGASQADAPAESEGAVAMQTDASEEAPTAGAPAADAPAADDAAAEEAAAPEAAEPAADHHDSGGHDDHGHGHGHHQEAVEPDVGDGPSYAMMGMTFGLFIICVFSFLFCWGLFGSLAAQMTFDRDWTVIDGEIYELQAKDKQILTTYEKNADGSYRIPIDAAMAKLAADPSLLSAIGAAPAADPATPDGGAE